MRVTMPVMYQNATRSLRAKTEKIHQFTSQVSSGKRLLNPADDPVAWAETGALKQGLREMQSFKKNLEFASSWNAATENQLNRLHDSLTQAREIAIAANTPNSPEEKAAYLHQLDQIILEGVDAANSDYDGRYLFNGEKFGTTPPFEATTDPVSGEVLSVTDLQGGGDPLEVRVAKQRAQRVDLDGSSVFYADGAPESIFQHLLDLKEAIRMDDSDAIGDQMEALEADQENVRSRTTVVGARMASFDNQLNALANLEVHQSETLSRLEGSDTSDMMEAITDLQQTRTVFESALKVTSMMDDLNLTRFI